MSQSNSLVKQKGKAARDDKRGKKIVVVVLAEKDGPAD
jgi:hypothetical protein